MVLYRRSLTIFGFLAFIFNVSAASSSTSSSAPTASASDVVLSSSALADIADASVVDPTDVESLFGDLVGISNSTNTTLLVDRSSENCKCTYGSSCWPADVAWDLLNLTLSGRLIKYIPAAAPCHNTFNGLNTYNANQCTVVTAGWTTEEFQYYTFI
jgi:hypothetical protein